MGHETESQIAACIVTANDYLESGSELREISTTLHKTSYVLWLLASIFHKISKEIDSLRQLSWILSFRSQRVGKYDYGRLPTKRILKIPKILPLRCGWIDVAPTFTFQPASVVL